ncbi:geranylgeranyl reductase family protein [Thermocrinis sp.]|uniref:geranylgeranyl reductase family protein n=1 Tax=Thermocrinis sp. TaxID=2024383 RepID=UPI002FDEBDF6
MKFDAVVVGGGPAGAMSAYELSKSGLKVLLIEKSTLPRFKLCAGCLSARIEKLLPTGWTHLIKHTIKVGTLGYEGREFFTLPHSSTLAYIVDRSEFDYFLVKKALEAGAEVWDECEFLGLNKGKRIEVLTSRGKAKAEFLIGADGFYSKVAKALGYKKDKFFRSLEFFSETGLDQEVRIDIGLVERGYAWVFPNSVGIASAGKDDLLEILRNYTKRLGLKENPKIHGWHIPYLEKEGDFHSGSERILLVGDASNCVDPLLGEGIYYAVYGATLATRAILANPSDPALEYKRLCKPMLKDLIYAGRIARIAYRFQKWAYKWSKKEALRAYYKLLTGEYTYKSLFFKAWLRLFLS